MKTCLLILVLLCPLLAANRPVDLKILPAEASLHGKQARQSLIVMAVYDDGRTIDVTQQARLEFKDKKLANLEGRTLAPRKDGRTTLTASLGKLKASMALKVSSAEKKRPTSFQLDVIPVFMRAGCNTGACHGSARGQDGFMLSLFGYDPDGDYHRITRELVGRRVDLAVPSKSLLLEKSIGAVTHTGGDLFTKESDLYETLHSWIAAGAPADPDGTPGVVSIELLPKKLIFQAGASEPELAHNTVVMATYSDGSQRDITDLAVFLTNNETTADINEAGQVLANKSGSAYVFARFDKFTVGSEVIVLPDNPTYKWPDPKPVNFVDEAVFDKLKKLQIAPSDLCSDEIFLRRIYLDLIGLPPPVEAYHSFLADKIPKKRDRVIDDLLDRPEFADLWAMQWGEMLQITPGDQQGNSTRPLKAVYALDKWIREQFSQNQPIDQMVSQLVCGSGSNLSTPPANFYTSGFRDTTAMKRAENFAQQFLGMRIQCAQCHNHPFDRWTMDDYYGFTSFFEGITFKNGADPREFFVGFNPDKQSSEHPIGKRQMTAKFLGGDIPDTEGRDPRPDLASWIVDNPWFAQNIANRAWAHFFGRGIVDPVDDVRISNPPSNAELLEALGAQLADYDFDFKRLVRDIVRSRTYQLSSKTNASNYLDEIQFSHGKVRRLRAEVMADTLSAVTGNIPNYSTGKPGMRATQLLAGGFRDPFLKTFGASSRESVCDCEVIREPNLSQALSLINGSVIDRLLRSSPVIRQQLKDKVPPQAMMEDLYIRTLSRKPSEKERQRILDILGDEPTSSTAWEDVFWGLINATEFGFNH